VREVRVAQALLSISLIRLRRSAACFVSDSISELLSRLPVGEVAGFRLGECVEAVAGCGAELVFEVSMFLSEDAYGFGRGLDFRGILLAGQSHDTDHATAAVLDVAGKRGQRAALRNGVVQQQVVAARLDIPVEIRLGEDALQAVHAGAVRPIGLHDAGGGLQAQFLGQYLCGRARDRVTASGLFGFHGQHQRLAAAQSLFYLGDELVCDQVSSNAQRSFLVAGLCSRVVGMIGRSPKRVADHGIGCAQGLVAARGHRLFTRYRAGGRALAALHPAARRQDVVADDLVFGHAQRVDPVRAQEGADGRHGAPTMPRSGRVWASSASTSSAAMRRCCGSA
jgi:hypothetical protein